MTDHVKVERAGAVLAITLARPERRNAITVAMYAALADAVESAANDPTVRLITLEGDGEDFTAGNDLADFLSARPDPGVGDLPVWRYLRALADNAVPILACVQGNAVGIGTTMLMHCDLVVAERGCRFHLPFVDLGLVPEAASSLIMPDFAGRRRAARHLLLAEPFGAEEALTMGLASHVAERGEARALRDRLVATVLAKPAEAMRQTQALLRRVDRAAVLDRMELENGHFAERLQSDEVKQAIAAFFAARAKA
ncbi:enoyl-CoA hydratase/isomerase family protein [Sphingomonas lutea]|uniref:Enoyl-CoA hydratase/isomerase family protein n=1 Tax=Sphingomonas lutea TaxID=1045317 RepID=A0A7G9SKP4_9SPHN|nr:enoyl-CoA hydratase-related protein [Sphingomonas lutea]QNN68419.1 enoyl-CoA hydratase/isomerase family protein [Sphingomonas lutea]